MLKDKFHTAIATGFWVGKIPFAPGTFGSLLAVAMWVGFNHLFIKFESTPLFIGAFWIGLFLILTIIGIFSAEAYAKQINKEDPGEIVIDEICGQLLAFLNASIVMNVTNDYLLIFLTFIFFRLFDITKPFVIGLADKNIKGGFGIMLDDLISGVAAAVLVYAVYVFILA